MGLVAFSMRYSMLVNQKYDLEMALTDKMTLITQLQRNQHAIMSTVTGVDVNSPQYRHAKAQADELNLMEKELEQQANQFKQRLQAVESEMQQLPQYIQKAAQTEFSYSLGGGQ